MKAKKLIAAVMATVMSAGLFLMPQAEMEANAFDNWNSARVYTYNSVSDIANVSICTPPNSVKGYAGLSWEQMEMNMGVRMNVTQSACGNDARVMFNQKAASLGASVVKILDMDLEFYIDKNGFHRDVDMTNAPLRIAMTLPNGCDTTKDYAFISIKRDGNLEILGDLDGINNGTITVDSSYFDTWALIVGKPGAFNAYRYLSPTAINDLTFSNYTKYVGTTVSAGAACHQVFSIGMVTDATTVQNVVGGKTKIEIIDVVPGPNAQAVIQNAALTAGARGISYHDLILTNGHNNRVYQTSQPLVLTVTVPFDYPVYADYAVAILNADGSVTIQKDIDINDSTVSFSTTQFRNFAILWGPKGSF